MAEYASPHCLSIGSLTGPVPFNEVIRSLKAAVNEVIIAKDIINNNPGQSIPEELIDKFIQNIARIAEQWTEKRIACLDAIPGPIHGKDRRLFDHDLIEAMRESTTYVELMEVFDAVNDEPRLHFNREFQGVVTYSR